MHRQLGKESQRKKGGKEDWETKLLTPAGPSHEDSSLTTLSNYQPQNVLYSTSFYANKPSPLPSCFNKGLEITLS